MEHYIIKQLRLIRQQNIKLAQSLTEEQSKIIIDGHNNNILWNLGHLYLVLEKFSFGWLGAEVEEPEKFPAYFGGGSNPRTWDDEVPSLEEMIQMMEKQMQRIEEKLPSRLNEVFEKPYISGSGLQIDTVQELLSFALYHEGLHLGINKSIKQKL